MKFYLEHLSSYQTVIRGKATLEDNVRWGIDAGICSIGTVVWYPVMMRGGEDYE